MVQRGFYSLATFSDTRDQRRYRSYPTPTALRRPADHRRADGRPRGKLNLQVNLAMNESCNASALTPPITTHDFFRF